jgi:CheY-like chemotaxis protein/phosphoribosyl 1,2-cyclic phosphodiesterase
MAEKRLKVLVVDDDLILRELATDLLADLYEIAQAEDGQAALEKALAWRPDLVVTDLMMPRMHGYELCERLKGAAGLPGVKVLVASSKLFPADIAQAKKAGADAYITKPYNVADLRAKVGELLADKGPAAPVPPAPPPPAARRGEAAPAPFPSASVNSSEDALPVHVRFWGTRGSIPMSGPGMERHGGNTACVEVRAGDLVLVLDCGTGMRGLGLALAKEFKGRPLAGHIFVGHTHWDHIQGFPFFVPLYNPANSFSIYSVHGAHGSLNNVFRGTMSEDYFPVPLSGLAARLDFVEMSGPVAAGGARVSFAHLNHPGVCIGFRIEVRGRVICYLSDHENFYKLAGDNDLARRQDAEITEFVRGSDLLIREAQYTEEEYPAHKGWGHSTLDDAVRDAAASGVKRLAMTHHDPDHTDDFMDAQVERCRALSGGKFDCFAAKDGLRVDL